MRNIIISVIYFAIGAVHLYTRYFHGEYPDLEFYSKIALMPVLILSCFALKKSKVTSIGLPLFLALLFSWFGDILLTNDDNFLLGLGAFFVAHGFFIYSFLKSNVRNHEVSLLQKLPIYMFGLIFISVMLFLKIQPNLEEMLFPVVAYMAVLVGMNIAAMNRYKRVNTLSFWLVMIGGLLFMVSDTLIAFDRFNNRIENAGIYIMSTYIIAQFLIVQGTLKRLDEEI